MLPKKIGLIMSGTAAILLIIWDVIGNYSLCDFLTSAGSASGCPAYLGSIETALLPLIPLFALYVVTFFVRDEIYQSWFRFARWWIPLSMLLIFISPEYPTNLYDPIQKGSVAFVMSGAFVVISIITIAIKYFSLKRTR